MAKNKITTVFDANNRKLKTAVTQGATELQKFKRMARKESRSVGREWGKMAQSVGSALQKMSAVGVVAFGAATKAAADFGKEMSNFQSIALQSEADFKKTTRAVLKMNATMGTAQAPKTLAAGLYQIQSAGFEAADALKILEKAAIGADAGAANVAIVADGLTTELQALGLTAKDSQKTLDLMTQTVQRGKVTMEQYSANIGTVAADSKVAGVSQEELHGAIALLTKRTGQANQSFSKFQSLIIKMSAPPKEARKKYDELGISYGKAAIKANGLIGQLRLMKEASKGDDVLFRELLGGRQEASTAANVLLGGDNGASAIAEIAAASNAAGTAQAALAKQSESVQFKWKKLTSTMASSAIILAETVAPAVDWVTEKLQALTSWFVKLDPAMQRTIGSGAAVGTVFAGVAGVAATMAPAIVAGTKALKLWAGAKIGATAAAAKYMTVSGAMGTAVSGAFATVTRIVTGFVAGPVGATIAAAGTLYAVWNRNLLGLQKATRSAFGDVWKSVRSVTDPVMRAARDMGSAFVDTFREIKNEIGTFISSYENEFRAALVAGMETVKVALIGAIEVFKIFAKTALPALKSISAFWQGDFVKSAEYAKEAVKTFVEESNRGWDKVAIAAEISQDRVWDAAQGTHQGLIARVSETLGQVESDTKSTTETVATTFGSMSDTIASSIAKSTGESMRSFAELRNSAIDDANAISAAFAQVGRTVTRGLAKIGKAPNALSDGLMDQLNKYLPKPAGGGDGHDHGHGHEDGKKSRGFDRAEAMAFIRQNAKAGSNLSGLGSLKDNTIEAMREGIERGMENGIKLLIHSTFRPGSGHHGSGEAFDASAFGAGITQANDAAVLAKLFSGTAIKAVIDENRQGVLAKTGGSGAHSHLTSGFQKQFKGTDGRDAVIYTDGQVADFVEKAHKKEEEVNLASQKFIDELITSTADHFLKLAESSNKVLRPLVEGGDSFRRDRLNAPADLASQSLDLGDQYLAKIEANEAANQRIYESDLKLNQLKVELGMMEREQFVLWLQEQSELEDLSMMEKLERYRTYNEQKKAMDAETNAFTQQLQQTITGGFQNFLTSTMTQQTSFSQAFKTLWKSMMTSVIQQLVKAILKATILQKILSGIGGFFGGIFGFGAKIAQSGSSGGALAGLAFGSNHSGGMVGPDPMSRRMQSMGALGTNEVFRKLEIGEGVIDKRTMRHGVNTGRSGGGDVAINFHGAQFHNGVDVKDASNQMAWQLRSRLVGA